MKRTLFGVMVMSSLVGLGSFGVYFAQQKLAPKQVAADGEPAPIDEPRDATPIPIPVANYAEPAPIDARADVPSDRVGEMPGDAASAGNPFVGRSAAYDDAATDPYQTADDLRTPAVEPMVEEPRRIDMDADYRAADEIPDANQLEGYDDPQRNRSVGDPYAAEAAYGAAGYAGQTVAAEVAEDATAGPTPADPMRDAAAASGGEPRRLAPEEVGADQDPYDREPAGNPLREQQSSRRDALLSAPQQPVEQRYAEEEFPDAGTAAQRYAPASEPSEPTRSLTGDNESFANRGDNEGTGRPGDAQLGGAQAPALVIEKAAPAEIQIGKPAKFAIKVTNAGSAVANGVEIHDEIPRGTQLLDTTPPAKRNAEGHLVWELGSLNPGDERSVGMQLMPTAEGEIGSVATVHFHAAASVRTVATKPMLNIEVFGPSTVHKGEVVVLRIKVSNPGSGSATGVLLSETVPDGLAHQSGKELEVEVGTLEPGGSRELDLSLVAAEAGVVNNLITVKGDGKLHAEARTEIEVVAPRLQVEMSGPKRRYLERNATHNISITNPGTAPAKDIDLVAVLPRTLQFVEANNGGQFDEATHAVYWSLEELPPQQTGTVKLTTLPLEAGEARLLIKSTSKDGLKDESEEVVTIEGLAAINFQLSDVKDPIEVEGETSYEIRVTNQGSKAASNVRLGALLPSGLKLLSADGPSRHKVEGQQILFEPIKQLAPKADTTFTLRVKALAVGDQRLQVQVATDEIREPITKEESTRVYGDE